jgi:hypothetical protein
MKIPPKFIRTKVKAFQKTHQMLDPDILLMDLSKESTRQALQGALRIPIRENSRSTLIILDQDL